MEKKKYNCIHEIFLIGVFLITNVYIVFSSKNLIAGFLVAVVAALLLLCLVKKIQSTQIYFGAEMFGNGAIKILPKIISLTFLIILTFLIYINTVNDYVSLVSSIRLPNTPRCVISAVLIGLSVIMAFCRKNVIYAFSLTSGILIFVTTVLLWVLAIPNMRFNVLNDIFKINLTETIFGSINLFAGSFGQIIIIILFIGFRDLKTARKSQYFGFGFASFVLVMCFSSSLLLLGNGVLENVKFPYAAATGIITVGKNFSRLDGFTYYNYFILSLLKISVIYKLLLTITKSVNLWLYKITAISFPIICLVITSFSFTDKIIRHQIINYLLVACEIILTTVFLLFFGKTAKKRRPN